jgi:hypothetical protein
MSSRGSYFTTSIVMAKFYHIFALLIVPATRENGHLDADDKQVDRPDGYEVYSSGSGGATAQSFTAKRTRPSYSARFPRRFGTVSGLSPPGKSGALPALPSVPPLYDLAPTAMLAMVEGDLHPGVPVSVRLMI